MFTRVELGNETADHTLFVALLKRGQRRKGMVENIVIFYNRKWNCSLRIGRTAQFAAAVYTHKKDDRVESIYAKPRCDNARTRGKHSIQENFLWIRKHSLTHSLTPV